MNTCRQVRKMLPALGSPSVPSKEITKHLGACPACCRVLEAERLGRGLFAVLGEGPEPSAHFVRQVLEALPIRPCRVLGPADPWRSAWGLIPAFTVVAGGLLFLYHPAFEPDMAALVPTGDLCASERLVFGPSKPSLDLIAAAVLRADARTGPRVE